jgi:hypothetical protein
MAEPRVTQPDRGTAILPTRFAGLRAEPAPGPGRRAAPARRPDGRRRREDPAGVAQGLAGQPRRGTAAGRRSPLPARAFAGIPRVELAVAMGREQPERAGPPGDRGDPRAETARRTQVGTGCLFSVRVIQPSLQSLRSTRYFGYGVRFLTAERDPLLDEFWKAPRPGTRCSRHALPRMTVSQARRTVSNPGNSAPTLC